MYSTSPNSSVSDLVSYFEQQKNMPNNGGQDSMAQRYAIRPDSTGRLSAMGANLDSIAMKHTTTHQPFSATTQNRTLAQGQSAISYSPSGQSTLRRTAPQYLKIAPSDNFAPFAAQSPYSPTASLAGNGFASYDIFNTTSLATERALPSLASPMIRTASNQSAPHRRGHARQDSQMSTISMHSTSSFDLPQPILRLSEELSLGASSPILTPPSSPKKRKSPSKSPQKAKERPNYLDKAIKRETGVTQQQINDLIGDPLPEDPKNWRCMWEGCTHVAARKENIRAHVQTHLGDRPYECPECHADFVRPHDFTRHFTTHVDSRDFKCPDCPQAFNRADALQRHRDRDFCNGNAPPESPTKAKRTVELIEQKKDAAGRRQKKQASRKRNVTSKRQQSADFSDDWWSSSAGSPVYLSSDADSPEMMIDSMTESQPAFGGHSQDSDATITAIEQILSSSNAGTPSNVHVDHKIDPLATYSLSPPSSPEESHAQLPLKRFEASRQNSSQEPTPPASRDSMLDFLSTGAPSVYSGIAHTVASGPSLPDLSSASPSPLAFEPVHEFVDEDFRAFCNKLAADSAAAVNNWTDWYTNSEPNFVNRELMINFEDQNDWMRRPLMTDGLTRSADLSPDELLFDQ